MRRAAATLTTLAALAIPGAAVADATSFDDNDGEVIGNVSNPEDYDILSSSATRSGKTFVQTVTLAGSASTSRPPLLLIDVSPHVSRWCDYVVGRTSEGTGVFECEYMRKTGSVKITRTGSDTIRYSYRRSALGNRRTFGWAVITRAQTDGTTIDADRAPGDPDEFVQYR
jgi:hypothetical protein